MFTATAYASGDGAQTPTVADLNGDGILDVAIGNDGNGVGGHTVGVLLGLGDGGLGGVVNYSAGYFPTSVVVADFNGDGIVDLAVSENHPVQDAVDIYLGAGGGTFDPAVLFAAGDRPAGMVGSDFDGHSFSLLVVDYGTPGVTPMLPSGDGGLTAGPVLPLDDGLANSTFQILLLNPDAARPDAVVVNDAPNGTVTLLHNLGDGSFVTSNLAAVSGTDSACAATALDLNGDGLQDLVVLDCNQNRFDTLLANGDGGFSAPVQHFIVTGGGEVVSGDFNGDGLPDLAFVSSEKLEFFSGYADGGLSGEAQLPLPLNAYNPVAVDFDGDGRLDLVMGDSADGEVVVLTQTGCQLADGGVVGR